MNVVNQFAAFGSSALGIVLPFLFVLTIVVFVHEFGHFQVARWCKIKVETFSIGFGKEIFGWNDRHGTRWKVAWIPLGGYVKFFGDSNAASAPISSSEAAAYTEAERAEMFQAKPVWSRFAVVAAGPVANFILAVVIFTLLFSIVGRSVIEPRIGSFTPESAAKAAGLRPDDIIRSVDGYKIETFSDLQRMVQTSNGRQLSFVVTRDGRDETVNIAPRQLEDKEDGKAKSKRWVVGIEPMVEPRLGRIAEGSPAEQAGLRPADLVIGIDGTRFRTFMEMQRLIEASQGREMTFEIRRGESIVTAKVTARLEAPKAGSPKNASAKWLIGAQPARVPRLVEKYDPLTALYMGARETWFVADRTFSFLHDLIGGLASTEDLGGPIRIAEASGEAAGLGFAPLISLVAFLSVSIGLLNLFPIPMLDGGHLVFYLIEAIRGRPLSERSQEIGFRVGLALVLMLMVVATWNDLARLVAS